MAHLLNPRVGIQEQGMNESHQPSGCLGHCAGHWEGSRSQMSEAHYGAIHSRALSPRAEIQGTGHTTEGGNLAGDQGRDV